MQLYLSPNRQSSRYHEALEIIADSNPRWLRSMILSDTLRGNWDVTLLMKLFNMKVYMETMGKDLSTSHPKILYRNSRYK